MQIIKPVHGFLIVCSFILFWSCRHKSVPVITQRTELPPKPVSPAVSTPDSTMLHAGQLIYTTTCTNCHKAKPVANWTVEQWKPILVSMIRKAKLDPIGGSQVTAYVNANARKE